MIKGPRPERDLLRDRERLASEHELAGGVRGRQEQTNKRLLMRGWEVVAPS